MFLGMANSTNSPLYSIFILSVLLFLLMTSLVISASADPGSEPDPKAPSNSVSAIFVFGDSTSDPGNNNYVTTPFKSNFSPYGRDFPNRIATGRFTNGRLAADFIASYVGVKELVPPYLDDSLSVDELLTGVSFASAGSGYDPLTPRLSGVISMSTQLDYFKEYKTRVETIMGEEQAMEHIHKALFLISAGTNDFVVNYYTVPLRRRMYTVSQYQQFLLQNVHEFVKGLWELGARKIGVVGLPPIGCLPMVITLKSDNSVSQRGCIESLSSVARDYNQLLETRLFDLQLMLQDCVTKIVYVDAYSAMADMVHGTGNFNYSFEQVSSGCCGTGYLEASFLCNRASYVCRDASKYMFWDSIHPTEMTYYLLFRNLTPVIDYVTKN
uniref:Triacylglycerol lipase n=1 Tax=Opuntia streptacantha TaxID=393608 RepID=A0A7C9DP06_OPUST